MELWKSSLFDVANSTAGTARRPEGIISHLAAFFAAIVCGPYRGGCIDVSEKRMLQKFDFCEALACSGDYKIALMVDDYVSGGKVYVAGTFLDLEEEAEAL